MKNGHTSLNNTTIYIGPSYMPDGSPVPDLLTEEEAIKYLRLDENGLKNPKNTLKYYRDKDMLRGTRVGHKYCYQRKELLEFLDRATERTNQSRS